MIEIVFWLIRSPSFWICAGSFLTVLIGRESWAFAIEEKKQTTANAAANRWVLSRAHERVRRGSRKPRTMTLSRLAVRYTTKTASRIFFAGSVFFDADGSGSLVGVIFVSDCV